MSEQRSTLAILALLVSLSSLAITLQGHCSAADCGFLPSVISLVYGAATAICLASKNFRSLSRMEFFLVTAAPMFLLTNLGGFLMLFSLGTSGY